MYTPVYTLAIKQWRKPADNDGHDARVVAVVIGQLLSVVVRPCRMTRISTSGRVSFLADASVFLFGHAQANSLVASPVPRLRRA